MQWCCGVLLSDVQNSSEIASGFASFTFPMDLSVIASLVNMIWDVSIHASHSYTVGVAEV